MDMRIGMFVRFTDRDDSGKYSYDGEVVSLEKNEITFDVGYALMTVPMSEQDKFEEIAKPKGYKRGTYASEKAPELPKSNKVPLPSKKGGVTTRERVFDIVRANPDASRQELIKLCGEQGIGPGSASTYIALARKTL